jgi:hypothetical protein
MFSTDVCIPIAVVVVVSTVVGFAVGHAVHFIDQKEITSIEKRADMKIARVEDRQKILEKRLKEAEVGR